MILVPRGLMENCLGLVRRHGCIRMADDLRTALEAKPQEPAAELCAQIAEGATAYTQFQTVEHYKIATYIAHAIRASEFYAAPVADQSARIAELEQQVEYLRIELRDTLAPDEDELLAVTCPRCGFTEHAGFAVLLPESSTGDTGPLPRRLSLTEIATKYDAALRNARFLEEAIDAIAQEKEPK